MSLVEQLAAAHEQQEDRRAALTAALSQSLIKMGIIQSTFAMPELSGLRAQYSLAFMRLMSQVIKSIADGLTSLMPVQLLNWALIIEMINCQYI